MNDQNTPNNPDPLAIFGPNRHELPEPGEASVALDRRQFLLLTGLGGLVIGVTSGISSSAFGQISAPIYQVGLELNHYIQINPEGEVIIFTPHPEVGQGVRTSLPMIVAEELDADWSRVTVKSSTIDPSRYGQQFAGGSTSILRRKAELSKMGAMARHMLVAAGAIELDAPADQLTTSDSFVIHQASGRKLSYGELAELAAKQPMPDEKSIVYKDPADYRLLGKRITSVDNRTIVTGEPIFGSDVSVPGMLYATFVKSRSLGGRVKSANLDEVKRLPGVVDAFVIEGNKDIPAYDPVSDFVSSGVAIVADSTWQAFRARDRLHVEWDLSTASTDDTDLMARQAEELATQPGAIVDKDKGNVDDVFAKSGNIVESFYHTTFASHSPLEPNNCTVHFKGDSVEVWAPSQTPPAILIGLMKLFGLPMNKVVVHQIRGGGGFGRRLENDYAREAALISKRVGAPVKLQWKREDELAFDYFRPPGYNAYKASLNADGKVDAWLHHTIAASKDGEKPNRDAGSRLTLFPENMLDHYRTTTSLVPSQTPTGPMRAPTANTHGFAEQSFIHELAIAAGKDHVEFYLDFLGEPVWTVPNDPNAIHTGRAANTIKKVAENAGWGREMPAGRGLGLSFYFSHATYAAEVAEVSVDDRNRVKVHKVWAVCDCGPVVNLSGAEGQAQGAIIDGIGVMAQQSITFKNGAAQQTNFHQYPLLRINQHPEIEVAFVESDFISSGMGEPTLPPIAAAVTNAIYNATGKRIRGMPISNEGFSIV